MGDPIPQEKGHFLGKRKKYNNIAAVFAAKGIIQSPITSCSRRDHSVAAAFAANGIAAGKGVMGVHSVDEV